MMALPKKRVPPKTRHEGLFLVFFFSSVSTSAFRGEPIGVRTSSSFISPLSASAEDRLEMVGWLCPSVLEIEDASTPFFQDEEVLGALLFSRPTALF